MLSQRRLGNGPAIGALGLGCMGMSEFYGRTDDAESMATLERAFELGVTYFDTADIYGFGANEELLARFLPGRRDRIFLATKGGILRKREDPTWRGVDNSPAYLRGAVEASLRRLRTDCVDLYYVHRIDPRTPIADAMGTLGQLVAEGKIRHVGLSNATAATVRAAHAAFPVTAVQNEFSLFSRGDEDALLPTLRELGIGYVPYSPMGRGLLTGTITAPADLAAGDFRINLPRFQGDNFARNLALVERVKAIAAQRGATPGQIALAWVLHKGPDIVPIPGTKRRKWLEENLAADAIRLTPAEMSALEQAFAPTAVSGEARGDGRVAR